MRLGGYQAAGEMQKADGASQCPHGKSLDDGIFL